MRTPPRHSLYSFVTLALLSTTATAQLANGRYSLTDTLNASTGTAEAETQPSGNKTLKVTYTKTNTDPPTVHIVNLAWNAATSQYVDNVENPTKRFYWVIVGSTTYYWYDVKENGNWRTDSSGTMQ
jgi:hypothetical protein